ncbi:hypothetical protein SEA_Phreeze_39 [Mycobacterium phage Phreeze]|nr:hypothetical protein SEA_Phreeze_39 [Mycobacterium phage Phreeze]
MENGTVRVSTQLRNPLVGMQQDELAARFSAKLLARLIVLERENIGLRVRLELATGEPWDSQDFLDMSADQIHEEVAESLVRGLGISKMDALKRVRENYECANPALAKSSDEDILPVPPQG